MATSAKPRARSGERFQTVTSQPVRAKVRAIALPISPRPKTDARSWVGDINERETLSP